MVVPPLSDTRPQLLDAVSSTASDPSLVPSLETVLLTKLGPSHKAHLVGRCLIGLLPFVA